MKKNISIEDRIIRFVFMDLLLGASLVGYDLPPVLSNIAFLASIYLIITIVTGYSPLYQLAGLSTIPNKEEQT